MLYQTFKKAVQTVPDKIALQFENSSPITYSQLDREVSKLAHRLLMQGVQKGNIVAVYVQRSSEQVISFLAILKLGCVYLPLNPEEKPERLKNILNSLPPQCLVTHNSLAELNIKVPVLVFNEDVNRVNTSVEVPDIFVEEDSLAYIICSSGTTGDPKFIPIKHIGLNYWIKALPNILENTPEKILGNTAISFDPHIWEYMMTWIFQGTLYLTNQDTYRSVRSLAKFIETHQITDATLTPAIIRDLNKVGFCQQFTKQSEKRITIYSTGEACTEDMILSLDSYEINLINAYGPSEATFGLSLEKVSIKNFYRGKAPVALPWGDDVSIQIVDASGCEISEGEVGHLRIISPYLSPGYIQGSKEDNNRFQKINISEKLKTSFLTDDLFLKYNGKLFYQGRMNATAYVKIRAQKINPLATEERLRKYPAVHDVCVVAKSNNLDEYYLVAYLVMSPDTNKPTIIQLRKHLSEKLSEAAIPSFFVYLDALPITLNGKIDREELINRNVILERNNENSYVSPRTSLECKLIELCNEILIENIAIGVTDILVMVGGNSLNISRLIIAVEQLFLIDIPIAELGEFEELTIERFANFIYLKICDKQKIDTVKLIKNGNDAKTSLFLIHPITGESSITYRRLASKLVVNKNIYAINAPMLQNDLLSCCSLDVIARHYVDMIRKKQSEGPYYIAGWSSGSIIAYFVALELEKNQQIVSFLGLIDELSPHALIHFTSEMFSVYLLKLRQRLMPYEAIINDEKRFSALTKRQQIKDLFSDVQTVSHDLKRQVDFATIFLYALLQCYSIPSLKNTELTLFITKTTVVDMQSVLAELGGDVFYQTTLGWSHYNNSYRIVQMEGDHFSIVADDAEMLANKISGAVNRNNYTYPLGNGDTNAKLDEMKEMLTLLMSKNNIFSANKQIVAEDNNFPSKVFNAT